MSKSNPQLGLSLLILRLSVVIVMAVWTLDKFLNPAHTAAVFSGFYGISDISQSLSLILGVAQGIVVVCLLIGVLKFWSRLIVVLMAAVGTLTPFAKYFDPFSGSNILFFAAWPMLAAAIALFLLRDSDNLLSLN